LHGLDPDNPSHTFKERILGQKKPFLRAMANGSGLNPK